MTNEQIKKWIENIINAHRYCLEDSHPHITANIVMRNFKNETDVYQGIVNAFKACGYDIHG